MLGSIPRAIQEQLCKILQADLREFHFCSGGCINRGGMLSTSIGDFFLKWNDKDRYPHMFECEAKGLSMLRQPACIDVPEVIATGEVSVFQFILMQFIEEKNKTSAFWETLGTQLASLHRNTAPTHGLDHDNFIGSLKQLNTARENWVDFFIENRLEIQLKLAADHGRIENGIIGSFHRLYKNLPDMLPAEAPSLLHGDLWSGNLITNSQGAPCLIDPAVYYGNREAEIAFTMLFGGFSDVFYESYDKNFPLFQGFSDRVGVYNLYPLLVHVNLFGGGYLTQVVSILRHFV